MNYKELADLLYPNVTKTVEDYEKMYPERDLKDGQMVTRFAPSPTGRIHMGNLFASFVPQMFARQTNGTFILRIEDTDQKRAIENGVQLILDDLHDYGYKIDEDPVKGGAYGPYIQTARKEIYEAFAKHLVSIGRAYPCFCSEDDLNHMREVQEAKKDRIGYYGHYAKCRNLTIEEVKEHLDKGDKFVLRLKSMGDFNKRMSFTDLIKGTIELPENDIDQVLIKSDGIPPYAFAHVVDDHLMRVTHVTRDDSYISSVPYHFELWDAFGFKKPEFAHILPICKKDEGNIRKISKRKDPEAAISFYHENGYPKEAIKYYLATLVNSNFEEWYLQNPKSSYADFTFSFDKMSTSMTLFDLDKLVSISRDYISTLKAEEVYDYTLKHVEEFDTEFYNLLTKYKDYTINVLNIEREVERPRKDIENFKAVRREIEYMYDELFNPTYEKKDFYDKDMLIDYIENVYDENDDKQTWFNKIKELCPKYGFCTDNKEYKANPDNYKGNTASACEVLRVAVTGRTMSPDLYEILKLLGKDRIKQRIEKF